MLVPTQGETQAANAAQEEPSRLPFLRPAGGLLATSASTHPSTMESPRISLRFLKKLREMRAKECRIFRNPVMVSIRPRLLCKVEARFSAQEEEEERGSRELGWAAPLSRT